MFPHKISTFLEAQHIHSLPRTKKLVKNEQKGDKGSSMQVHLPLSPVSPHRVNLQSISP